MKVLIIEDEKLAAEKLTKLLQEVEPDMEIISVLESVEEAVNWITQNPSPELIFMDIQLDDGISFEIFDEVKIEAPIIFTTAYDEYAIRAFKVNSVDYLLKPIEKEALKSAIKKFKTVFFKEQDFEEKVAHVIGHLSKTYKSRFFIRIGNRFQSILTAQICCFYVEERNTFLKTIAGKNYDLDYSLEQLQKMVDPGVFFRANRNYLVNINCINEIISYSTNRLKLKLSVETSEDVIVSRDKVSAFKRWMDN